MLKIASSNIIRTKFEEKYLIFASLAGLEIDLKYLNFQKKKLLCRIISDAAFSWPELMDEGKEGQGGGTVDKPSIRSKELHQFNL